MENCLKISFTGDIAFSQYFFNKTDNSIFDIDIVDFLNSSDYCIANIEGPLTDSTFKNTKKHLHANNPKSIEQLMRLHCNIWNLGNNHILDCGETGLLDTQKMASEKEIMCIGAGASIETASKYIILEEAGGVGIISVATEQHCTRSGINTAGCLLWDEESIIAEQIKKIKKCCRWCIVVAHGGDEFCNIPLPRIRNKFLRILNMGADIIVGHHPHVVQNYEAFPDGKIIFYSLGNFIFDTDYQRLQKNTDVGILLRLNITNESVNWDRMPIRIYREDNNKIRVTDVPIIFRQINYLEYKRLWPMAAYAYWNTTKIRLGYMNPKNFKNRSRFKWIVTLIKNTREKGGLELLFGIILYKLGLSKKVDKELVMYFSKS